MGRKPTGKVRKNLNITLHPETIMFLERLSETSREPISRIIERLVQEERGKEAAKSQE
jgi:hypothetical protein